MKVVMLMNQIGHLIFGEFIEETDNYFVIKNPKILISDQNGIRLLPYLPLKDVEIKFNKNTISIYPVEISEENMDEQLYKTIIQSFYTIRVVDTKDINFDIKKD